MDRRIARFLTAFLLFMAAIFVGGAPSEAVEPTIGAETSTAAMLNSGPGQGEYVPTFYSRAVTGPLMNKSVCYVCRNGQRPVVAVYVRSFEPKLKSLLRNIDRVVDLNRVTGLRSFSVKLGEDPFRNISAVQTFSFNNKIAMPFTVASEAVSVPSCQNIHTDAAITVVFYRRRRVERTFAFRAGEMTTDEVRTVIQGVKDFAAK
ncbi:MAG: hypothetical protein HON53_09570 [Planctomycetaceae bacterium]|jgi:hypothetical protein|nr:hypothetical protein [Planctomycetaceae bacterium]MBT6157487.1 hypothetical protein [Planctomycetaceae bacterium]MBT6486074.1 hypothetical protein [Planctomycetaceae bacterium]MBT6495295.1 hypothetical protein [Planctomycetaceae bacterium]